MSIVGVIYKIVCNDTNETYYGSTTNYIKRKRNHISSSKISSNNCKSYDIINRGNFTFIIVETLICETKSDLLKRERYYIENNECVNIVIPIKTYQEHLEYRSNYKKEHRERLSKMELERYYKNKDEILKQKCIYRENNRDKIKEQQRNYYDKNRDEINKKNREKPLCLCECGLSHTINHKSRHLQTARHKKMLEKNMLENMNNV